MEGRSCYPVRSPDEAGSISFGGASASRRRSPPRQSSLNSTTFYPSHRRPPLFSPGLIAVVLLVAAAVADSGAGDGAVARLAVAGTAETEFGTGQHPGPGYSGDQRGNQTRGGSLDSAGSDHFAHCRVV